MNNDNSPTKVFAKVQTVTFNSTRELCNITFLGTDNKTVYTKTLKLGMNQFSDVLDNMGCTAWDSLPATRGNVVQLALYDGVARYINKAKIVNGQPVSVWKPMKPTVIDPNAFDFKSVPMAPAHAKPAGSEPLPGQINDEEGDKMFPAHAPMIGGVVLTDSKQAQRDANIARFAKLSLDMQEMTMRVAEQFDNIKKIVAGGK
jgi:hypothetical protein